METQPTLANHIAALNAKTAAWVAEDPTNRFSMGITEDLAHWASYGITTVEQFERHNLETDIWDLYKTVNGIRPRWMNFSEMTVEELKVTYDGLCEEARKEVEAEEAFTEKHGYSSYELEEIFWAAADEAVAIDKLPENLAEREEEQYHLSH